MYNAICAKIYTQVSYFINFTRFTPLKSALLGLAIPGHTQTKHDMLTSHQLYADVTFLLCLWHPNLCLDYAIKSAKKNSAQTDWLLSTGRGGVNN